MFDFNAKYFKKHQSKLLFIANKWYLRWLLGLNRLPRELRNRKIDIITPNSIGTILETRFTKKGKFKDRKIKQEFFSRPRFAEALAYNLTPFVYFQQFRSREMVWRFSPVGVLSCLILFLLPKASFIGFFGTTTSYYSGSGNGIVNSGANGTNNWANVRESTSGGAAEYNVASNANHQLGQCTVSGGNYYMTRAYFPSDTSGLTSGATISAASFNVYFDAFTMYNGDSSSLNIIQTSQASSSALADTDFDNVTLSAGGATALASISTTTGYKVLTIDATGLTFFNKTGYSLIGVANSRDVSNNAPAGLNQLGGKFYYAGEAGTSKDPYYSVTYTVLDTRNLLSLGVGK